MFIFFLIFHHTIADIILENCSVPVTQHSPFNGFANNAYQFADYESNYCFRGSCAESISFTSELYDSVPSQMGGTGPFFEPFPFNCSLCTSCQCPSGYYGAEDGLCCNSMTAGPGCVCPRISASICQTVGGASAGQCATNGFSLLTDDALTLTSSFIAQRNNWTEDAANLAFVGTPPVTMTWSVGLAYTGSITNCPAIDNDVLIVINKYYTPLPSCLNVYQTQPVIIYNSQLGVIVVPNCPGCNPAYAYLQLKFSTPGQFYLSQSPTDLSDFDNPPASVQGFTFTKLNGGLDEFTVQTEMRLMYRVTQAWSSYLGLPTGTILEAFQTIGVCDISTCGAILFGNPATITNQLTTAIQYLAPFSLVQSRGTNLDDTLLWTQMTTVQPPAIGCTVSSSTLIAYWGTFDDELPTTELTQCVKVWGHCNAPAAIYYNSSATTISVFPNYFVHSEGGLPVSETSLYLTYTGNQGYAELLPGDSNGNPLPSQVGFTLTAASGESLLSHIIEINIQGACLFPIDACGSYVFSSSSFACTNSLRFVQMALVGPMPVQIADCSHCENCVCDSPLAERGDGSMCCPPFRAGYQCSIRAATCADPVFSQLCSGNGDPFFPNNLNGTGCYLNSTTDQYVCACLPGYVPPYCLARYDATCGNPICNNRGSCSLAISNDAQFGVVCYCDAGYRGAQCEFPIVECFGSLDAPVCSGHGYCEDPDEPDFGTPVCICDEGYVGVICESELSIDCRDPVTNTTCSERGICIPEAPCGIAFPAQRIDLPCTDCTQYFGAINDTILAAQIINGNGYSYANGLVLLPAVGGEINGFSPPSQRIGPVLADDVPFSYIESETAAIGNLDCTEFISYLTAGVIGLSGRLYPGVYCMSDNPPVVFIQNTLILDGNHDPRSVFVFLIPTYLEMDHALISVTNEQRIDNVYFVTPSVAMFSSSLSGILVISGTIQDVTMTNSSITGGIYSNNVSTITLTDSEVIRYVNAQETSCSPLPTTFDLCNMTTDGAAELIAFCQNKIGFGKRLLTTDPEYDNQVFLIPELQCLANPYSLRRGFAVTNLNENECVIEQTIVLNYFFGEFSNQFSNVIPCAQTTQRAGSIIRLYTSSASRPYKIFETCYGTSEFGTNIPIREAIQSTIRVGDIPDNVDGRVLLLRLCLELAQRTNAPYYGVESTFNRCWIPGVNSPTVSNPPSSSMNAYPDYVYGTDTDNPNARLFMWAVTPPPNP